MLTAFFCAALLQIGISWIAGIHHSLAKSTKALYGTSRVITQDFHKRESLFPVASNITPLITHPELIPKITFLADIEADRIKKRRPIIGLPLSYLNEVIIPTGTLSGRLPQTSREIILGASLAQSLNVIEQDSIIVMTQTQDMSPSAETFRISGVITTHNTLFDQVGWVTLSDAQWMTDMEGATELISSSLSEQARRDISAWSTTYETPVYIHTWKEKEPYASVRVITDSINRGLLFFILACATLTIFNIALINMNRVQQELGILRSLGATKSNIIISYLGTSLLLVFFGTLMGISIALILLSTLLSQGFPLGESLSEASYALPMAERIMPHTTWNNIFLVFGLILSSGFLGSAIPCVYALRNDPMRTITHTQR